MGYILCTTEKPSVAENIANAIGANTKKTGYYEGNGYRVTWAVGHLVDLAEPHIYDAKYEDRNNLDILPFIPSDYKYVIIEKTKKQFMVMKKLMNDEECDSIIDCGDMGETGHYLQWLIRMMAGCKKPVKRFCATSMTNEAIKDAFNNLRNIEDFENIIESAKCKAKGDWLIGMNFSRLFSAQDHNNITVGRVQSPTMFFVVNRWEEIKNFKPKDYYNIECSFVEGFKAVWTGDTTGIIPKNCFDDDGRLLDKGEATTLSCLLKDKNIGGGTGKITKLETKLRGKQTPQLYDITELQRDGNRIFGYTASEVLKSAQRLYETYKVLTYPRTDSRYITSDLVPYMTDRIKRIANNISEIKYKKEAEQLLSDGLKIDKHIVDDSKVTDHHALIVTENIDSFDWSKLETEIDRNILDLICTRMIVALSAPYTYYESSLEVQLVKGQIARAKGNKVQKLGWKLVQKNLKNNKSIEEEEQEDEVQLFNSLSLGQTVMLKDAVVIKKTTTPPKLHTEATLLTDMENAGKKLENDGHRKILSGKGIGTQATRAEIIKKLFDVGYVKNEKKGKVNYLVPTKKGYNATKILPRELLSPELTAQWEEKFARIADKNDSYNADMFLRELNDFIHDIFRRYRNVVKENVSFEEKVVIGECLFCGKPVIEFMGKTKNNEKIRKLWKCEDFGKGCLFFLDSENTYTMQRTKKALTSSQAKKLLEKGEITLSCIGSKTDNEYMGRFVLTKSEGGFANIVFKDFVNNKKKKKSSR